jgi:CDP-diacylglycerol--serine O-phosphatidyltransferase
MIKHASIADLISLLNVGFGFLAIFILLIDESFVGSIRIHIAFSLILLALLADGLDGIVARKTKSGKLGDYIESMADMTSMSIAPLVFLYSVYHSDITSDALFLIVVGGVFLFYLSSGVIRLASFHLMKQDQYFIGLPASAATIILLVLAYLKIPLLAILGSVIILSFLLVSSIPFPKTDTRMNGIATILIFGAIVFSDMFSSFFLYLLLFSIVLYSLAGSIFIFTKKDSKHMKKT